MTAERRHELSPDGAGNFLYGPWYIAKATWIRPHPSVDWDYWHRDYDGPGDNRCGSAATRDACLEAIHMWEDEHCAEALKDAGNG